MNTTAHVLIVTGENIDGVDDRTFTLEHRGLVDQCAIWAPCPPGLPCHSAVDDPECTAFVSHGVEHVWGDDEYVVRTDPPECIYLSPMVADDLPEVVEYLTVDDPNGSLNKIPIYAGRYLVQPTWLGDGDFHLQILDRE